MRYFTSAHALTGHCRDKYQLLTPIGVFTGAKQLGVVRLMRAEAVPPLSSDNQHAAYAPTVKRAAAERAQLPTSSHLYPRAGNALHQEAMPTIDELDQMDEPSGVTKPPYNLL